jgi:hypothetical protein
MMGLKAPRIEADTTLEECFAETHRISSASLTPCSTSRRDSAATSVGDRRTAATSSTADFGDDEGENALACLT